MRPTAPLPSTLLSGLFVLGACGPSANDGGMGSSSTSGMPDTGDPSRASVVDTGSDGPWSSEDHEALCSAWFTHHVECGLDSAGSMQQWCLENYEPWVAAGEACVLAVRELLECEIEATCEALPREPCLDDPFLANCPDDN